MVLTVKVNVISYVSSIWGLRSGVFFCWVEGQYVRRKSQKFATTFGGRLESCIDEPLHHEAFLKSPTPRSQENSMRELNTY